MSDAGDRADSAFEIREAAPFERASVLGVLDAAMLETDATRVRELIEGTREGGVFVAVEEDRLLGALVLEGADVTAVAVRPGRRGQGIGSALLGRAAKRVDGELVAEFDESVRPFYERRGFEIEPIGEGRFRGRLD